MRDPKGIRDATHCSSMRLSYPGLHHLSHAQEMCTCHAYIYILINLPGENKFLSFLELRHCSFRNLYFCQSVCLQNPLLGQCLLGFGRGTQLVWHIGGSGSKKLIPCSLRVKPTSAPWQIFTFCSTSLGTKLFLLCSSLHPSLTSIFNVEIFVLNFFQMTFFKINWMQS